MGKIIVIVSVALFIALMLAALVPLVLPDAMRLAGSVLCTGGEQAVVNREYFSDRHGSGFTQDVECVGTEGQRRLVDTFTVFLVEVGLFFPPSLIVTLLLGVWLMRQGKAKLEAAQAISLDGPAAGSPPVIVLPNRPQGSGGALADKLRQLEEAYRAGLITPDEYNRERQEILDGF